LMQIINNLIDEEKKLAEKINRWLRRFF
jgi:hypothetical protein